MVLMCCCFGLGVWCCMFVCCCCLLLLFVVVVRRCLLLLFIVVVAGWLSCRVLRLACCSLPFVVDACCGSLWLGCL